MLFLSCTVPEILLPQTIKVAKSCVYNSKTLLALPFSLSVLVPVIINVAFKKDIGNVFCVSCSVV